MKTVVTDFEVVSWEVQEAEDEPAAGAALGRALVTKRFSGALEGTSVAHVLTAVAEAGRGYVAIERVDGALDGQLGTFVIQHGSIDEGGELSPYGAVVPGSGTGELAGLRGSVSYFHEGDISRLTLSYALS